MSKRANFEGICAFSSFPIQVSVRSGCRSERAGDAGR